MAYARDVAQNDPSTAHDQDCDQQGARCAYLPRISSALTYIVRRTGEKDPVTVKAAEGRRKMVRARALPA